VAPSGEWIRTVAYVTDWPIEKQIPRYAIMDRNCSHFIVFHVSMNCYSLLKVITWCDFLPGRHNMTPQWASDQNVSPENRLGVVGGPLLFAEHRTCGPAIWPRTRNSSVLGNALLFLFDHDDRPILRVVLTLSPAALSRKSCKQLPITFYDTVSQKNGCCRTFTVTLWNFNQFRKSFHCWKEYEIGYKVV